MTNRGALDLLLVYDDELSSDEDVPGCTVSTKRSLKEPREENPSKRLQIRLPPPIIDVKQVEINVAPKDDPSQHNGRQRSFPHERGNWATFAYIPFEPDGFILDLIISIINSLPTLNLQQVEDFHISVTKTVILRYHWIDPFVRSIKDTLSYVKRFVVFFDLLDVYCNDERTRTFIGLKVRTGIDSLSLIVQKMDSCLEEFKLSKFYESPSFHMSIVWCTGDHEMEIKNILDEINGMLLETTNSLNYTNYFLVDNLKCKTGNKLFTFLLN